MTTIRDVLTENYLLPQPFSGFEKLSDETRHSAVLAVVEDLALDRMTPEDVEATQDELAAELVSFVSDILAKRI